MTYVSVAPYANETYGTSYFADRLRADAWDDASSADRTKALKQASNAIDKLNFAGHKHDETLTLGVPTQPRQFPRGDDTDVPVDVLNACCELALALLDDVDPNLEVENLAFTRQGIGEAAVNRDTSYGQEHIRAGIPSLEAWNLLLPYLRDTQHPRIELHRGG